MSKKNTLIITGTALAVITALCIITATGTYSWITDPEVSYEFFAFDPISANVSENLSIDAQGIKKIEVTSIDGDITFLPGSSNQIDVDLVKTGWGGTKEEALSKAQSLEIEWKKVDDTLVISFDRPRIIHIFTFQGGSNKIDMTFKIPPGIHITSSLNNGDIIAKDLENSLDLEGKFGNITMADITGRATATNRDGDISINNLNAPEENVSIQTEFGDIEASELQIGSLFLLSRDGDIEIRDAVSHNTIEIEAKFGNISLEDFSCNNLSITERDGKIDLQTGEVTDEIVIDSQFGDIEITDVDADSYSFEGRDGDIDLSNAKGLVTANVKFGDIHISNSRNITLSITMQDGDMYFLGTLNPAMDHNVENRFGNVTLTIPDDSNFNLSVETRFGEFTSDIPIQITIGPDSPITNETTENKWVGQINHGGPNLSITTQDGDITLKILEN